MFLGVSGSVLGVEMNERERANFAAWLRGIQKRSYGDVAKAAYTAAGVNSGTWDRAVSGLTLKPRTVAKIVAAFRPDTEGDWAKLRFDQDAPVGAVPQDRQYVAAPDDGHRGGADEDEVLRAIRAMHDDMRAMDERLTGEIRSVSERVDRLEGPGA